MERVHGIGGVFFESRNPTAMSAWYDRHLGVDRRPQVSEWLSWRQAARPTVFGPLPADTPYSSHSAQMWMLKFRRSDPIGAIEELSHE